MVPETLVWYALMPAFVRGLIFGLKRQFRAILPIVVFAVSLTLAYALMQGNIGTAYRQRTQVTMFFFIFMAVGIAEKRRQRAVSWRRRFPRRCPAAVTGQSTASGRGRARWTSGLREAELRGCAALRGLRQATHPRWRSRHRTGCSRGPCAAPVGEVAPVIAGIPRASSEGDGGDARRRASLLLREVPRAATVERRQRPGGFGPDPSCVW